jgi:galactonate dehydratase
MKIVDVRTYLVGNPWKNWMFVRVDTDEGIHGLGEGTVNGFSATVAAAVEELHEQFVGVDVADVEQLHQRMVRDVYSDGGQIHMAAVSAVEIACWDIVGKARGLPIHRMLGGRVRDRVRLYANGWYQTGRTPDGFAGKARLVVAEGFTALKLDPFGAAYRVTDRVEENLALEIVEAVRDAVGPSVDLMIEGHNRFSVSTALRVAERLAEFRCAWFEEPVAHHNIPAIVEVARRSPVPVATGESYTTIQQFAELLAHGAVHILQPEPLHLGGFWKTRLVAGMADAHYGVVAPHNAQGPLCSAVSLQLGACIPNFYVQESFDAFNADWTRQIVDRPLTHEDGHVMVDDRPGLGIDLDWERIEAHPYQRGHVLKLFEPGWERREAQAPAS